MTADPAGGNLLFVSPAIPEIGGNGLVMHAETGVTVRVNSEDVAPLYRHARVAVVPLHAGGGT